MNVDSIVIGPNTTLFIYDSTGKSLGTFGPFPFTWTLPKLSNAQVPQAPPGPGLVVMWVDADNIINYMDATGTISKFESARKIWPLAMARHAVVVGNDSGVVKGVAPGTAGWVLTSAGPEADPVFAAPSIAGGTIGQVLTSTGATTPATFQTPQNGLRGTGCIQTGTDANAGGTNTQATGAESFATGSNALANEDLSTALGQAWAFGYDSIAMSNGVAVADDACAINNAIAAGVEACAVNSSTAVADASFAASSGSACGHLSVALGGITGNPLRPCTISGTTVTIAGGDYTLEFTNTSIVRVFYYATFIGSDSNFASGSVSGVAFAAGNTTFTLSVNTGLTAGYVVAYFNANNQFIAQGALSSGIGSQARLKGQHAHAANFFSRIGDCQTVMSVIKAQTTDATGTEMFIDPNNSYRLVIPNNTTGAYRILAVARRTGGTDTCAQFTLEGFVTRGVGVATTRVVTATTSKVTDAASATWTVVATADVGNGSLKVTVTGEAGKNINWAAQVRMTEVAE